MANREGKTICMKHILSNPLLLVLDKGSGKKARFFFQRDPSLVPVD